MATVPPDSSDDTSISNDVKLLRRIPCGRYSSVDGRPDSSSFKKDPDGIGTSVTMWLSETDLAAVKAPKPEFGVVGITAGQARASGFWIQKTFEQGNPNHCELGGQVSNGKREKLSKASRWVHYPDGYPEEFKSELWTLDAD